MHLQADLLLLNMVQFIVLGSAATYLGLKASD